jgi:hypothetical protein
LNPLKFAVMSTCPCANGPKIGLTPEAGFISSGRKST